jgi:hypothetical protein
MLWSKSGSFSVMISMASLILFMNSINKLKEVGYNLHYTEWS